MTLAHLVHAQDQINWVPFECSEETSMRYVSLKSRESLFKVNASWPENETRPVTKWINNSVGISMGDMPGGEYFITLEHPDETISPIIGYQNIYIVSLQVGDGLHSEDCDVRTEPTPVVLTTVSVQNEQTLMISGISHTSDTVASDEDGWGGLGIPCTLHEISIITDVFSGNTLVFSDTTICEPGVPTEFSTQFFYEGPYAELCTQSRMEKRSLSNPATFPTKVIVLGNQVCQFAGQMVGQNPSIQLLFNCEDDFIGRPPTTGGREFLVRFNINWPGDEEEKLIYYNVPNHQTGWANRISSGQFVHRGENYILIHHDDVQPVIGSTYWQEWHSRLSFYHNGNFIESQLFIPQTEPDPIVYGEWLPAHGDSVSFSYGEHSQLMETLGWGSIPDICSEYELILIKSVTNVDGEPVFTDTVFVTPGLSINEEDGLQYTGELTELCLKMEMQRVHLSSSPHFEPQTVVVVDGGCISVGSPTTITETSVDNQVRIFPNPTTGQEVRILGTTSTSKWSVFATSGKLVFSGDGELIDTSLLSPGVYVVNIEKSGGVVRLIRQ